MSTYSLDLGLLGYSVSLYVILITQGNYPRCLSPQHFHGIQTCFIFQVCWSYAWARTKPFFSPFTKASVECVAQISNCTHFSYKSWVIPSCLCSKRLVSNVKNFCESFLLRFEPVHTPHQYFLKKGQCTLHTYMINHASNKIRTYVIQVKHSLSTQQVWYTLFP